MCRLLGWVEDRPVSVEEVLGPDGLAGFTSLAAVHDDGWGMAWREGDVTRTVTSPESAGADPSYAEHTGRALGRAGLLHLRWATGGLPVAPRNTHPFFEGDHAFAHNGHVSPIESLEDLITPECRERLVGDTDSERYFRFVLQCVEERGGDLEAGVRHALAVLVEQFPSSSLNALMLTPTHLVAIHVNSRADSPVAGLRALFDDEDDVPPRHLTEYFAMDHRVDDRGIVVISSGLDEAGWTPVEGDTAVMIDLDTRAATRIDPVLAMQDEAEESP
jgi:predicted glutamine amidotransferase